MSANRSKISAASKSSGAAPAAVVNFSTAASALENQLPRLPITLLVGIQGPTIARPRYIASQPQLGGQSRERAKPFAGTSSPGESGERGGHLLENRERLACFVVIPGSLGGRRSARRIGGAAQRR